MTCEIGEEMQLFRPVLSVPFTFDKYGPSALDICMAPGGFTQSILNRNPAVQAKGISLPISAGGYEVMVPDWARKPNLEIEFLDVTMIASEMGVREEEIPTDHPDVANFYHHRPFITSRFDLVICGGAMLRGHKRQPYRDSTEALRLRASQLVLALQRIKRGGTLILLMHKAEHWMTIDVLRIFHKFSVVRLFKPKKKHAIRSSFYMIATDVQPQNPAAVDAVAEWKRQWRIATFGTREETEELDKNMGGSEEVVREVLHSFGDKLIKLARPVWKIQAMGLERVPFSHRRLDWP
jgi:23S rRNA U2552 (ribose-2'-O)-methylase RlmE/FtsJ